MKSRVAEAAAAKQDPTWLWVLKTCSNKLPALSQFTASKYVAVFIAGGPRALRDLRQTDLHGKRPSPFCVELQKFCKQVLDRGGVVGATGHGTLGLPPLSAEEQCDYAGRFFSGSLDSAATAVTGKMTSALARAKEAQSPPVGAVPPPAS